MHSLAERQRDEQAQQHWDQGELEVPGDQPQIAVLEVAGHPEEAAHRTGTSPGGTGGTGSTGRVGGAALLRRARRRPCRPAALPGPAAVAGDGRGRGGGAFGVGGADGGG